MMALSLTAQQLQLLRFIAGYQAAHGGVSPCLRECAIALGGKAKSSVHRLVTGLEERGAIRRRAGKHCAIEILEMPAIPTIDGLPLFAVPTLTLSGSVYSGERL